MRSASINRFWVYTTLILLLLLASFLISEGIGLHLFDPQSVMQQQSVPVALLGVAALVLDVLLPIPASLIMIANGALFGFWLGTLLSLIGSIAAALVGFALGRQSQSLLVARFIPPQQMASANRLFARWGMLAIIVTRPIPLLAETTVIAAGASRLTLRQVLIASVAGSIPAAALYALTGATAVSFHSSVLSFGLVLFVAALFWVAGSRLRQTPAQNVKEKIL